MRSLAHQAGLGPAVRAANEAVALLLVALLTLPPAALATITPRRAMPAETPGLPEAGASDLAPADAATRARVETALGTMPLYFVENRGQIDARVAYYVKGATNSVYFTRTGIIFELTSRVGERQDGRVVRPASLSVARPSVEPTAILRHAIGLDFEGANPEVKVVGRERTSAVVSHFRGPASEWKTGLPTYAGVVYRELWPGIDLVYGSEKGKPKYSFIVKPGANPDRIRLRYRGVSGMRLTDSGRVEVETAAGAFGEDHPYAYQEGRRDTRTEVEAAFEPRGEAREGEYRFGFRVGAYDRAKTLVLDPVQIAYCGYIGGSSSEAAYGIAVDSSGYAYVAGSTSSTEATFPKTVGPGLTYSGGTDAWVAKVKADGTGLVYCGYIGGTGVDVANGVAIDGSGRAYVVGTTSSTPAMGFPVTTGPNLTYGGDPDPEDAFVARISANGLTLEYCGYIGGTGDDIGNDIAVRRVGGLDYAYVVGHTDSTEATFPKTVGPDLTYNGGTYDAFVAKVKADGTGLDYCGYIGGSLTDYGYGIAVDGSGNAYVAGRTQSTEATFPVTVGPDLSHNGLTDAFVAKVNFAGTLAYCGYIGGSNDDFGSGIAVDASGNAYVTGYTYSSKTSFPVKVGPDTSDNGGLYDGFVAKVNAAGTALVYCGYIGGSGDDDPYGIAVDGSGNAYVTGSTSSTQTKFPVALGPDLTYNGGSYDVFVAKVKADGTGLVYCGYIGGAYPDVGSRLALDGSGNAYVVGMTQSSQAEAFPLTVGPDLTFNGGINDAFVAKVTNNVLAVELVSFSASPSDSAVDLSWETGSEVSNLGFHLYRATEETGPYTRITSSLVPGLGTSPAGARYSWRDGGLSNGTRYFYKLEDVETTGVTEQHGPVSATPQAGAPAPQEPAPPEPPGSEPPPSIPAPAPSALVAYGDPARQWLRVIERGTLGLTLELVTGGFYAEPLPDGTVRLSIPGFETLAEPGLPSLPVERTMVEALVGRGVRVASVQADEVATFSSLRPQAAGLPELVVSRDGTVQAGVRRAPRRAASRGTYPAVAARVVSVGFQGEIKKAFLELCPLRWDEASDRLLLARKLRVRVVFSGRVEAERGQGAYGKSAPRREIRRPARGLIAHLATRQAGLHAVRFEQLFGRGTRGLPASALRLSYQGEAVAFTLAPDPNRFLSGSTLYFLSAGPASNPFGNEAVYELASDPEGLRMARASASPSGAALTEALSTREYETNRYYLSNLPTAPDPWLWEYLRSGETKSVLLPLSLLAAGEGHIEIALVGVSDYPVSPDHHLRAFLNGASLGEVAWDGQTPVTLAADVPAGVLREGDNSLELHSVPDASAPDSLLYLDRVSLGYPRPLQAESGRFEASFELSGEASVPGLDPGTVLLDTTSTAPLWLTGGVPTPGGLVFHGEAGHRYLAVSPEALLAPEVRPVSPTTLRAGSNHADFILVAPRAFLGEAEPLLAHRRAQGLSALAVAAEELYAQFGHGEARPEAIRDFLAYAFHNWRAPAPRYVLLLGDASYDPKNYLGYPPRTLLPTPLIRSSFLFTASDPSLGALNGEDGLPDVAIGRLPATTVEEAHTLVQKTIAWEQGGHSLEGLITLVSDNPDEGGDFESDAETIAHTTLASRDVEHLSLAELGTTATRDAIRDTFDRGSPLLSYVGHGSIMLWASEQLLKPLDVDALAPQGRQPLVLAMNCLNSFFHLPAGNSLSEKLVKAEGKGAVATFSSSGMSFNEPTHRYHAALLAQIASEAHERLGDALLAAQADYANSGADPELLALYHLLGDPALKIR